jgi:hypothetical protein
MERNRPDPTFAALQAPQSVLETLAFAAGDCEMPAAVRLRAGEPCADEGRPPAGEVATAGAAADATLGGEPGPGSFEPALGPCVGAAEAVVTRGGEPGTLAGTFKPALPPCVGAASEFSAATFCFFCPSIFVIGSVPLSRETRAALLSLLPAAFSLASLDVQMSAKTRGESPENMQPMI